MCREIRRGGQLGGYTVKFIYNEPSIAHLALTTDRNTFYVRSLVQSSAELFLLIIFSFPDLSSESKMAISNLIGSDVDNLKTCKPYKTCGLLIHGFC